MKNTIEKINSFGLDESLVPLLSSLLIKAEYPKGHVLIREGRNERSLYFLETGIARAFSNKEEKEVTFWFGKEGDVLLSLKSYFANEPGYESIELLEKAVVYQLSHQLLARLYDTNVQLANWGRKFAEYELILAEERHISRHFKTASERYDDFMIRFPGLINRVKLSHVASYLGISQVSLSRIRGERR
ncbi:hypothetical protein DYBT9275_05207 [Dyadobacter sp. CECT 9275]|uniref:Cyclic nucleotide-binding domain-containing protein n=1 Tax=Dyadobacter helix TaxID=2822344 RepID=A0A916NE83_9BACT|nr:Crp/Fnr family transcriptional regulator [Dyadobacter sp. CECT 9275]CAG5012592.1 hypothetical protein DYBT9275_05207 [Dyadobacter sp. CECT 9275]